MTEYSNHFNDARLLSQIDAAEELLGQLSEEQVETLESEKPDQFPRLQALLPRLREVVDGADPLCVTTDLIDRTRDALASVAGGLQGFVDSGGVESLNGIRSWTEELAKAIGEWPARATLPSSDVREIASRFRRSAGQQLRGLSKDFAEVEEQVGDIRSRVDQRASEINEIQASLDSRLTELQGTIEQQRGRLDESIERYQEQFSEAQERRIEEFRKEISQLESSSSAATAAADQRLNEAVENARAQADQLMNEMRELRTKAEDTAGVIGATGTSAGYRKEADAQEQIANWLRASAVLFGLVAAGLAVWAIIHAQQNPSASFSIVLSKVAGALVFGGIAGYLATQSGHHRAREEQARRRQLDLIALPPFIATLPDEEKEEITREVASRIFVNSESPSSVSQSASLTKENISLVGLLLDAVRRS